MRFGTLARFALLVLAGLAAGLAQAALPFGELTFRDRVAEVDGTETIDVWVRLTLDASSSPLTFSSSPLTGFDPADLPTEGTFLDPETQQPVVAAFASIDRAYLNTYFTCDDTFTNGCNGPDPKSYTYSFFTSSEPGKPSINFRDSFDLQPGQSFEYVFAQFLPTNGAAAPGTYRFFSTGVTLNFEGVDAEGNFLTADPITLAATCASGNLDSCAFTRIVPVPEPQTYLLMALGLGMLAWIARNQRGVRAA